MNHGNSKCKRNGCAAALHDMEGQFSEMHDSWNVNGGSTSLSEMTFET